MQARSTISEQYKGDELEHCRQTESRQKAVNVKLSRIVLLPASIVSRKPSMGIYYIELN